MRFEHYARGWLLVVLAACGGERVVDETVVLTGLVTDGETAEPLAGAIVTTAPETERAVTDSAGRFTIEQGGKIGQVYQLSAVKDSYMQAQATFTAKQGTNSVDLALTLVKLCSPGPPAQVRCALGGEEGVETCGPRGASWLSAPCPRGQVCDPSGGAHCVTPMVLDVSTTGDGGGVVISQPGGINCGTSCEKGYPAGTSVTLTANPFALSSFRGWTGDCAGTSPVCNLTMDAARTVGARFDTVGYQVRVTRTGRGLVTSMPAGITCGSVCAAGFPENSMVTLTAEPSAGQAFEGWRGACTGTQLTCVLTLDSTKDVEARFMTPQFPLVVSKLGTGAGQVRSMPQGINCGADCEQSYDVGTPVTLTANPAMGSTFMGWGGDCAGTAPCMLTMDAAHNVSATFDGIAYPVTVSVTGQGTVSSNPAGIDCNPDCNESFGPGTVTLTANPGGGSVVGTWGGDCAAAGGAMTCDLVVDGPKTVSHAFAVGNVDLTVNVTGTGVVSSSPAGIDCGADCAESFMSGTNVTLSAAPTAPQVFGGWGGACAAQGLNPVCNLAMNANRTVSASFVPFYLAPLPPGGACLALLHFDNPSPLAQGCGGGADAALIGTYAQVASRAAILAQAYSAGGADEEGAIALNKAGPAPPRGTVELTLRKAGAAFNARGLGVVYSDGDALAPNHAGVRVLVYDDGRLAAETRDGLGGTSSAVSAAGAIVDGTWYHVAATFDATMGVALFIDGAAAGSSAGALAWTQSSSTAWAGAEREGAGAIYRFNGAIDELRVSSDRLY